jgi:uncharacterized protein (UPF0332 family)
MADTEKSYIIQYRIQQAKDTIAEIEILIQNRLFKTTVNRIYYGMFYMLLALALKYNFKTSKHQQLIGWFNRNFIKTGEIELKYGKIINDAFENRSDSDYGLNIEFSAEDIQSCLMT